MKFLLLLLALGLVTSDKLDRTYLPPPGAKLSGGTVDDLYLPVEYPKEVYSGTIQNEFESSKMLKKGAEESSNQDMRNGKPTMPYDFSTPTSNNFTLITPFSTVSLEDITSITEQGSNSFNSFPSTFPNTKYLPSNPTFGSQSTTSYPTFYTSSRTGLETSNLHKDGKVSGYYYFMPTMQANKNVVNSRLSENRSQNDAMIQYPNQMNDYNFMSQRPLFIQKPATTNDIVQNYQPSAFGYYGGNPMIMTLEKDSNNIELTPKFGKNENKIPALTTNQKEPSTYNKLSVKPIQTPVVGMNFKNDYKISNFNSSTMVPDLENKFIQNGTIKSLPTIKEKLPQTQKNQKSRIITRPRYRPERPRADSDRNAVIVKYDNNISSEGYSYSYDTSNGIHVDESATTANGVRAKGSYSYTGDDGKTYTVTYTADENGFQAQGEHLPTPPPVPESIKRVIEQAARDKAAGIVDDGSYDERKYGYLNYENPVNKYFTFKKSDNKPSKFNSSKTKPINRNDVIDINNNLYNSPISSSKNPASKGLITENKEKVMPQGNSKGELINRPSYDAFSGNNVNEENLVNIDTKSRFKENVQNTEQYKSQNRRPITTVNDDQFTVEETQMRDQNRYTENKKTTPNKINSNTYVQDQFGPPKTEIPRVTLTDNGYYYVPPLIEFNPNIENPTFKKSSYGITNRPTSKNEAIRRNNGFDENQKESNNKVNSASLKFNENITTTTTRKPYISGPDIQDTSNDLNILSNYPIETENKNEIPTYSSGPDSTLYLPNTTPMTPEVTDASQSEDYIQYYKQPTNPTLFDKTLPSSVENRVNVPSGKPRFIVSQDFTTTLKPATFKDGVLEVNQNVKIYGPDTVDSNGYPENISGYNNDAFYPTSTPNVQSTSFGISDSFYPISVQDTEDAQEFPNQNTMYENKYLNIGIDNIDAIERMPGSGFSTTDGPYSSPSSGIEAQGYPVQIPEIPFPPSTFGNEYQNPGHNLMSSTVDRQSQGPDNVIGEDFSGPKQAQKFDPLSGYYYK